MATTTQQLPPSFPLENIRNLAFGSLARVVATAHQLRSMFFFKIIQFPWRWCLSCENSGSDIKKPIDVSNIKPSPLDEINLKDLGDFCLVF